MNEKIYVVIEDYVWDGQIHSLPPVAFRSKTDAEKYLQDRFDEELTFFRNNIKEEDLEINDSIKTRKEVCDSDYWLFNHFDIRMTETELR